MIINQHNSTVVITQDKTNSSEFLKKLSVLHERYKKNDLILQLKDTPIASMDALVSLSEMHRQLNYSFNYK